MLLIILTDAMTARNGHNTAAYQAEISAKLQRFKNSGIGKLGLSKNEDWDPYLNPYVSMVNETHAFWVKTPMGRRLGLYRTGHVPIPDTIHGYGEPTRVLTPFEKAAMKLQTIKDQDFAFEGFVAPEFESAAAQIHQQKWGQAPLPREAGPAELMQMGSGLFPQSEPEELE